MEQQRNENIAEFSLVTLSLVNITVRIVLLILFFTSIILIDYLDDEYDKISGPISVFFMIFFVIFIFLTSSYKKNGGSIIFRRDKIIIIQSNSKQEILCNSDLNLVIEYRGYKGETQALKYNLHDGVNELILRYNNQSQTLKFLALSKSDKWLLQKIKEIYDLEKVKLYFTQPHKF